MGIIVLTVFLSFFCAMGAIGFCLSSPWILFLSLGGIFLAALVRRLLCLLPSDDPAEGEPTYLDGLFYVLALFWVPLWIGGLLGHLLGADYAAGIIEWVRNFGAF